MQQVAINSKASVRVKKKVTLSFSIYFGLIECLWTDGDLNVTRTSRDTLFSLLRNLIRLIAAF